MSSNVYYFNPTAEMAIANGLHSYQAPGLLQTFEIEMASLMLYFAKADDIVVTPHKPHAAFLTSIQNIKPELSHFLTLRELEECNLQLGQLIPWAWSPVVYKTFEHVFHRFSFNAENLLWKHWQPEHKHFFDRQTAWDVLQAIYPKLPEKYKPDTSVFPEIATSALQIQEQLRQRGSIVLKTPFSSSGRGLQMLRKNVLNASNVAWIESALEKQKRIMVEYMHHKIADFSIHFYLEPNKRPSYLGLVYFKTNSNGQFSGCYINQHPETEIQSHINKGVNQELLDAISKELELKYNGFSGYLGIDAMLISQNGSHKIHPCVEINPRFTMGLLTLELRKLISNPRAFWEVIFSKKGNIKAQINDESVALTPVTESTRFAAILHPKG